MILRKKMFSNGFCYSITQKRLNKNPNVLLNAIWIYIMMWPIWIFKWTSWDERVHWFSTQKSNSFIQYVSHSHVIRVKTATTCYSRYYATSLQSLVFITLCTVYSFKSGITCYWKLQFDLFCTMIHHVKFLHCGSCFRSLKSQLSKQYPDAFKGVLMI
jgi:hypothetical protein